MRVSKKASSHFLAYHKKMHGLVPLNDENYDTSSIKLIVLINSDYDVYVIVTLI